jgi:glycosyltransferase involved in cell wall biosynthesis
MTATKRIIFVQAGNYAEAFNRFRAGGEETFFAQRYSVAFVASLAQREDVEEIVQICFTEDLHETTLPGGIRQLGIMQWPAGAPNRTQELIDLTLAQRPTHLVINTPNTPLIRAALKAGIDVYPLLADSFRVPGLKARLRYWWLGRNLAHSKIRWVTNRNLNASQDLVRIGVPARKVVPFDWPPVVSPSDFSPKRQAANADAPRLLYVGQVRVEKGVGDLIDATERLVAAGMQCRLSIIGDGDIEALRQRAVEANVAPNVEFLGKLGHSDVMRAMNKHDIVVVPSWHEYPEGMPNTIYEGLCSRTPLLVSDHPMFEGRIRHDRDCLVFSAKNVEALAQSIQRLIADPVLYTALSNNAEDACANYLVGAPWGDVITHWLGNTAEDDAWMADRSLAAERFRER